jgi:aspartate racemase
MRRVVAKTPAHDDADHIHLIVESNPKIPSRIAHLIDGTGTDPTPELIRIAANLQRAGADALAIPCNTAHAYADSIRRAVSIPLLDMVSLTVERLRTRGAARVGILASTAVHSTALFSKGLSAHGIEVVLPARQDDVMALIKRVKQGDIGLQAQVALGRIALDLAVQADLLLIACSELSVIAAGVTVPFVDSLEILAEAIVDFATAKVEIDVAVP